MLYNRQRYTLIYQGVPIEVPEPLNWKTDTKTFSRNNTYHGITTNLVKSLKFVLGGKDYLDSIVENYGINEDVKLVREIKNPQTDVWEVDYIGHIDFMNYTSSLNYFEVGFNADPITSTFKAKKSAKVELERLTSLKGEVLPELSLVDLNILGVRIFKISELIQAEGMTFSDYDFGVTPVGYLHQSEGGGTTQFASVVPLETAYENDDLIYGGASVSLTPRIQTAAFEGNATTYFYGQNDIAKTLHLNFKVNKDIHFDWLTTPGNSVSYSSYSFKFRLVIYNTDGVGVSTSIERTVDLWSHEVDTPGETGEIRVSFDEAEDVVLEVDQAMEFQIFSQITNTSGTYQYHNLYVEDGLDEVSVTVSEDSERPPSNSKGILIHEAAERLSSIILDAEFESELLGRQDIGYLEDGDFSQTALAHGLWLRTMVSGNAKFKPLATNMQDFFNAIDTVYPIGMSMQDEKVKIEKRSYFYQKHISIELGEVKDFTTSPDGGAYASLITVGYEKAGGYEENQGLDEFNRETQYNTIINKTENELRLVSKYRADGYGMETARRENEDLTNDTKFDDEIWMFDVELPSGDNAWKFSTWEKRFAVAPRSVFDPATTINLWYSPINILLRHGEWLKAPLRKYLDSKIAFNFSEGNSGLITQLIGGNTYAQDDGVPVRDLERSANKALIGEFESPVTFEQLNGRTLGVPNFYGLVKFTSEDESYTGHILSVSLKNGIGKFKVKIYN